MKIKSVLAVIATVTLFYSNAQAMDTGNKAAGTPSSGSTSSPASAPSGPSGPSHNSNSDNGSAYVKVIDCQPGTPRCKKPVKLALPLVVELPVSKCQVERWVQVGKDTDGAPLFRLKRDCDRIYIR